MPITGHGSYNIITPDDPTGTTRANITRFHGVVTTADLATANNGLIHESNGSYRCTRHLYFDQTCDMSNFRGIRLNIDQFYVYIHPSAVDAVFRDITIIMPHQRIVGNRIIFAGGSQWQALGGGYRHAAQGGNSGDSGTRYISVLHAAPPFGAVQIVSEAYSQQDVDALYLDKTGTYSNISGTGVKRILAEDSVRVILHDCSFSSLQTSGARMGAYDNASIMLNDCLLTRRDGQANVDNTRQVNTYHGIPNDQKSTQSLWFLGTSAQYWRETWHNQQNNLNTEAYRGSLRYLQFYLNGQPFSDFNYRYYSTASGETTPAARRCILTTGVARMTRSIGSEIAPVSGRIAVLAYDRVRLNQSNSWNTISYSNHHIRIRDPRIIFLDYQISDADIHTSVGRPGAHIPAVLQPDPHLDYSDIDGVPDAEINSAWSLDFTTRTITTSANRVWTLSKLYAYYKQVLSRYSHFDYIQEWTYDGSTLDLAGWSITFGAGNQLNGTGELRATQGQITNAPASSVSLVDSDGVSISISSSAPNTRAYISYGTTMGDHDLPYTTLVPPNVDIAITAKAPGYAEQHYEINTSNPVERSLDVRLPRDTGIDLDVSYTPAEYNTMALTAGTTSGTEDAGKLEIRLSAINLTGQGAKSKRILDAHMSTRQGLRFLHNYISTISGDPLGGRPIEYREYSIRMDVDPQDMDGKIRWIKSGLSTDRVRFGISVRTPTGLRYDAPLLSGTGQVVFDNPRIQDLTAEDIAADVAEAVPSAAQIKSELEKDGSILDTLRDRITAARATLFDNLSRLDAAISTRSTLTAAQIPAGLTAAQVWAHEIVTGADAASELRSARTDSQLSVSRLTNARATKLDNLDAAVSSRATVPGVWAHVIVPATTGPPATPDITVSEYLRTTVPGAITSAQVTLADAIARLPTPPTTSQIETAIWDHTRDGHPTPPITLLGNIATYTSNLNTRLTAARAAYLDAAISSRLASTNYTDVSANVSLLALRLSATRARALDKLDATISSRLAGSAYVDTSGVTTLLSRLSAVRAGYLDASVSSRLAASDYDTTDIANIKRKTDKLRFAGNDVKATLDGETVVTDDASRVASRATGFATAQDITSAHAVSTAALVGEINANETKIDAVKTAVDGIDVPTVAEIQTGMERASGPLAKVKEKTDKLRFTGMVDDAGTQKVAAEATVTGNVVSSGLTEAQDMKLSGIYTEVVVDGDEDNQNLQETVDDIKSTVDDLVNPDNVKIADIQTKIDQVKRKTDKLTFDNNTHVECSVWDVRGNRVNLDDFKADVSGIATLITKVAEIKGVVDRVIGQLVELNYDDDDQDSTPNVDTVLGRLVKVKTVVDGIVIPDEIDANVIKVAGSDVDSIDDFKATETMVDFSGTNAKIDAAKNEIDKVVEQLVNVVYDDDSDSQTPNVDTVLGRMNKIKSVVDEVKTEVDEKLDVVLSTRLASADYVGPDNEGIGDIKEVVENIETHVTLETHDHDGDENTDEVNTLLGEVKEIKRKTDKMEFSGDDDLKVTLDGEEVVTNMASREASKATGFATPQNVIDARNIVVDEINVNEGKIDEVKAVVDGIPTTEPATETQVNNARDNVKAAITAAHTTTDGKIDGVKSVVDGNASELMEVDGKVDVIDANVDRIKERTDKMEYQSEIDDEVAGRERLHTYTDVEVDNVEVNLDTVEGGVERIEEKVDSVKERLERNLDVKVSKVVPEVSGYNAPVRANVVSVGGKPISGIKDFKVEVKEPYTPEDIRKEMEKDGSKLSKVEEKVNEVKVDDGKVVSTLDGEKVGIDDESKRDVKAIGFATLDDVRRVEEKVVSVIEGRVNGVEGKVDSVRGEVGKLEDSGNRLKEIEMMIEELRGRDEQSDQCKRVVEELESIKRMIKELGESENKVEVIDGYVVVRDESGNEIARMKKGGIADVKGIVELGG